LVKWAETKSWEAALYAVIPKRKFQQETDDISVIDAAAVEDAIGESSWSQKYDH
jgi:hypothetical protein